MKPDKPFCCHLRDLLVEATIVRDRYQHRRYRHDRSVLAGDGTMLVDAKLLQTLFLQCLCQHDWSRWGFRTGHNGWNVKQAALELELLERDPASPQDILTDIDDNLTPVLPEVSGTRRVPAQLVVDLIHAAQRSAKPTHDSTENQGTSKWHTVTKPRLAKSEARGFERGEGVVLTGRVQKNRDVHQRTAEAVWGGKAQDCPHCITADRFMVKLLQLFGACQRDPDAVERELPELLLRLIDQGDLQGPIDRFYPICNVHDGLLWITVLDRERLSQYHYTNKNGGKPHRLAEFRSKADGRRFDYLVTSEGLTWNANRIGQHMAVGSTTEPLVTVGLELKRAQILCDDAKQPTNSTSPHRIKRAQLQETLTKLYWAWRADVDKTVTDVPTILTQLITAGDIEGPVERLHVVHSVWNNKLWITILDRERLDRYGIVRRGSGERDPIKKLGGPQPSVKGYVVCEKSWWRDPPGRYMTIESTTEPFGTFGFDLQLLDLDPKA